MAIGDSITEGFGQPLAPSYRYYLWNRLTTAGYSVDFVGSRNTLANGTNLYADFDPDHQGISGVQVSEVAADWSGDKYILPHAQTAQPDVALIHLGTNDLINNREPAAIVQDLSAVIDLLRSVNPRIKVILAQIIPCNDLNKCRSPFVEDLNAQIATLAAAAATTTSPVVLANLNSTVTLADLPDGLHPNDAGERRMAERWYEALAPLLEASDGTSLDDSAPSGAGGFAYSGPWDSCTSCDKGVGLYGGGYTASATGGATASLSFAGSAGVRLRLYLVKGAAGGLAAVSIDGGPEALLDLYSGSGLPYAVIWASPSLAAGAHTLTVRVTGQRSGASAGAAIAIDRAELFGDLRTAVYLPALKRP